MYKNKNDFIFFYLKKSIFLSKLKFNFYVKKKKYQKNKIFNLSIGELIYFKKYQKNKENMLKI